MTTASPDSIPRDLADLFSPRFSVVWEPKFREYCKNEDLKMKMPKKRWKEPLLDFMLSLRKLKGILSCDTRTSKMVQQKKSPTKIPPSDENISQNVSKSQTPTQNIPEVENIQNEKSLLCKELYSKYFDEDPDIHVYLIALSDAHLRTRLSNALSNSDTSSECLSQIVDDALEDPLVWIKLSEVCDKFLKQSVLRSENSPVAKSVAVLLSIL